MAGVEKAVILVGGKGTRLRSVVTDLPKPLAPIAGRPFLDHLLKDLSQQGIKEVILAVGYMGDKFMPYLERSAEFGLQSIQISREKELLGTGGALTLLRDRINTGERFLLVNGDTFFQGNLKEFLTKKMEPKSIHIGLCYVDDLSRFGSVQLEEDGRVIAFFEKQPGKSGLVNAGIYLLSSDILSLIPDSQVTSLEADIFPQLVRQKRLSAERLHGSFFDIGIPESYFSFHLDLVLQEASSEYGVGFSHILMTWLKGGRILVSCCETIQHIKDVLERRAYLKISESEFEGHLKLLGKNDVFIASEKSLYEELIKFPAKLVGKNFEDGPLKRVLDKGAVKYFEMLENVADKISNLQGHLTPYLFLDRDGVIIDYVPYIDNESDVKLRSGVSDLIKRFHNMGYRIVMVTNQSGIGREYFSQEQFRKIQNRTLELLAREGQWIDACHFSDFVKSSKRARSLQYPSLRKPRTGMYFEEAQFWNIDLERSIMIGDNSSDLHWAKNVGLQNIYYFENPEIDLSEEVALPKYKLIRSLDEVSL